LELWDNDGPTKALKLYMSFFNFTTPESWPSYRDIDERVVYDPKNEEEEEGSDEEDLVETK
jgi:hypothetical protein